MKKIVLLFLTTILLSSCSFLNQSVMFKTSPGYEYAETPDAKEAVEYKVSANDILTLDIYANGGAKKVSFTSSSISPDGVLNSPAAISSREIEYTVDAEGYVKLPMLGCLKIDGLTLVGLQDSLEKEYAKFYLKPFVIAKVVNRTVILFPGNTSEASTIKLLNNNTTLIELLAAKGGISENGKARKVKLIRKKEDKHEVYLIDLSTIEGIDDARLVLQANDIVYVEPRRKISVKALKEISPVLTLISTTLLSVAALSAIIK